MKDNERVSMDKISYADFSVAAAFTTITWAGGPVMLDEWTYGRSDATSASECASSGLPAGDDYVSVMTARGFSAPELVALANI